MSGHVVTGEIMEYSILKGEEFDESFLPNIMAIDRACYEDEYVGSLERMAARYRQNPRTFVCVMDQEKDQAAGYINFFPVKPALWDEIVEEGMKIRDDDIMPEELAEYSASALNYLFIISVAVAPEYRDRQAVVRMLTDGFIDYLNRLQAEGFQIGGISGTAVSEDGQKFLSRRMFSLYREIEGGNQVYLCEGMYLEKLLKKDLYFKTYRNDSYLFLPYADNEKNTRINRLLEQKEERNARAPRLAGCLLDALDGCLKYEYDSDIVGELERVFVGTFYMMHTLDETYGGEDDALVGKKKRPFIVGEEKVYLSLLVHHPTHMYILMMLVPDSWYSASQLEDQLCQGFLEIREEGWKDEKGFYRYQNVNEYLRKEYGLLSCGRGKNFICLSKKPENEGELLNILSAETYNSMHQDFHIQYPELLEQAKSSKAIYDYYEAYMTEEVVAFLLHDYDELEPEERMELTATYVFIIELVIFQNTALNKMTIKISNAFLQEGDVSYQYISKLYRDYAKTIKFWQSNNFKYYGTQKEAEQIRRAFENDELRQSYYEQQDFLEHMVDIENAQTERRNGMVINVAATVLAIIQVQEYMVGLLERFYESFGIAIEAAGSTFDVMVIGGGGLILLVMYILNRKRQYVRKKKLSRPSVRPRQQRTR